LDEVRRAVTGAAQLDLPDLRERRDVSGADERGIGSALDISAPS
jgi:hypothetical protein